MEIKNIESLKKAILKLGLELDQGTMEMTGQELFCEEYENDFLFCVSLEDDTLNIWTDDSFGDVDHLFSLELNGHYQEAYDVIKSEQAEL